LSIVLWNRRSSIEDSGVKVAAAPSVAPAPEADAATVPGREPIAVASEPLAPAPATEAPRAEPGYDIEVVDQAGDPIVGARIIVTRPPAVPRDAVLANYESNGDVTTWSEATTTDGRGRARFVPSKGDAVRLFDIDYVGVVVLEPSYVRSLAHYVPFP